MIKSLLLLSLFISINNSFGGNNKEIELISAVLILEAGGEPEINAMEAVFEVIKNRSINKNKSIYSIATQNKQFSCLNNKDYDEVIVKAKKHPKWSKALKIVQNNKLTHFTRGATHYYSIIIPKPYWAKTMEFKIQIGRHRFYKE